MGNEIIFYPSFHCQRERKHTKKPFLISMNVTFVFVHFPPRKQKKPSSSAPCNGWGLENARIHVFLDFHNEGHPYDLAAFRGMGVKNNIISVQSLFVRFILGIFRILANEHLIHAYIFDYALVLDELYLVAPELRDIFLKNLCKDNLARPVCSAAISPSPFEGNHRQVSPLPASILSMDQNFNASSGFSMKKAPRGFCVNTSLHPSGCCR